MPLPVLVADQARQSRRYFDIDDDDISSVDSDSWRDLRLLLPSLRIPTKSSSEETSTLR